MLGGVLPPGPPAPPPCSFWFSLLLSSCLLQGQEAVRGASSLTGKGAPSFLGGGYREQRVIIRRQLHLLDVHTPRAVGQEAGPPDPASPVPAGCSPSAPWQRPSPERRRKSHPHPRSQRGREEASTNHSGELSARARLQPLMPQKLYLTFNLNAQSFPFRSKAHCQRRGCSWMDSSPPLSSQRTRPHCVRRAHRIRQSLTLDVAPRPRASLHLAGCLHLQFVTEKEHSQMAPV